MTSIAAPQVAPITSSTPIAPAQPFQPQALGQMLGQILTGTVIALLNETTLRLQTPAGLLDVAAETTLPPGTPVSIAIQGSTQQPQIVITPAPADPQRQPAPPAEGASDSDPVSISTNSGAQSSSAEASANLSARNVSGSVEQPAPPARAASPITQAALSTVAAIVRNAAATQGSLGALYADLEAAAAAPALPADVRDAAKVLLAMRLDSGSGEAIGADDVKAALMRSGLGGAAPETASSVTTTSAADIGGALIDLRQTLQAWLDREPDTKAEPASTPPNAAAPSAAQPPTRLNAPISSRALPTLAQPLEPQLPILLSLPTAVASRPQAVHALLQTYADAKTALPPEDPATPQPSPRTNVPMPPFRGAPDVPQAPMTASFPASAPVREQAIHLLAQTDAALARQTLLRIVSLPGDQLSSTAHGNDNFARALFEIPIATPLGTAIAPMTIARDGSKTGAPETLTSWIASFSIDLPSIGPVHVRVALIGERASVTLSAERPRSADLLATGLPLLDAGLRGAQIEPGELRCRVGPAAGGAGNPAGAARPQTAPPGLFLNQAS